MAGLTYSPASGRSRAVGISQEIFGASTTDAALSCGCADILPRPFLGQAFTYGGAKRFAPSRLAVYFQHTQYPGKPTLGALMGSSGFSAPDSHRPNSLGLYSYHYLVPDLAVVVQPTGVTCSQIKGRVSKAEP